jgi:hypothetical protein
MKLDFSYFSKGTLFVVFSTTEKQRSLSLVKSKRTQSYFNLLSNRLIERFYQADIIPIFSNGKTQFLLFATTAAPQKSHVSSDSHKSSSLSVCRVIVPWLQESASGTAAKLTHKHTHTPFLVILSSSTSSKTLLGSACFPVTWRGISHWLASLRSIVQYAWYYWAVDVP